MTIEIIQDHDTLRNAVQDSTQAHFWFMFPKHLSWWLPDICAEENRHKVLPVYAGNNTIQSVPWLNTEEFTTELIEVLLEVIPRYGYEVIVFNRESEALHEDIIHNVNRVTQTIKALHDVKFVLTTSTYNAPDFQHRMPDCKVVGIAGFFMHNFAPHDVAHIQYDFEPGKKTFLNLNRVPKAARLYALAKFQERDLLKHSETSFFFQDQGKTDRHMTDYFKDPETMLPCDSWNVLGCYKQDCGPIKGLTDESYYLWEQIEQVVNREIIDNKIHHSDWVLDRPDVKEANPANHEMSEFYLFNRTRMSFINETHTNIWFGTPELEGGVFVSEKSAKALLLKHPFVLFGQPGHLRELRNMGFKTFHDIWDESYDTITHPLERFDAILDVMTELCSWSNADWRNRHSDLQQIVNHNFFTYINKRIKLANLDEPLKLL